MTETARRYLDFAAEQARGVSAVFDEWATGVGSDPQLLELIDELPRAKRQPNLVFGASRFLGAGAPPFEQYREWLLAHWPEVRAVALDHATQTNEAGRCAVLLPLLASIPGPLALIEVGASAGLCLYPDRYSYRYSGHPQLDPPDGPSRVVIDCAVTGDPPIPAELPRVIHRAGVDLNPLDVTDEDQMLWLDSLIWPGQEERHGRLRAAIEIARAEPAKIVTGDLNQAVERLVSEAPSDATVVVFHSAVLNYLDEDARHAFERKVRSLDCRWISNEGRGVIPYVDGRLHARQEQVRGKFVLSLDGEPRALTGPHGQSLDWLG